MANCQFRTLIVSAIVTLVGWCGFVSESQAQRFASLPIPQATDSGFRYENGQWVYQPPAQMNQLSDPNAQIIPPPPLTSKGQLPQQSGFQGFSGAQPQQQNVVPQQLPGNLPQAQALPQPPLPQAEGQQIPLQPQVVPSQQSRTIIVPQAPRVCSQYMVLYRTCVTQPYRMLGPYTSHRFAARLANQLECQGYQTRLGIQYLR